MRSLGFGSVRGWTAAAAGLLVVCGTGCAQNSPLNNPSPTGTGVPPPVESSPRQAENGGNSSAPARRTPGGNRQASSADEVRQAERRRRMVDEQLVARDIVDPRVLEVMRCVPRHLFVPTTLRDSAYDDRPLPIGHAQTISQPYIVALMTQLARPGPTQRALDVGTGSGYQAAVLSSLVQEVYSIEIIPELADEARGRLNSLGYTNVTVRCGDGYGGWPEQAPFDVIIVAAAPTRVPPPLIDQLAPDGHLIIPVGKGWQNLVVVQKLSNGEVTRTTVAPVAFVPMTGQAQQD